MIPDSCLIVTPPLPPARDFVESLVVSLTFEWQNRIAGFFPKTHAKDAGAVRRRRGYLLQEKFGLYFTDALTLTHFQLAIPAKSYEPDSGQILLT